MNRLTQWRNKHPRKFKAQKSRAIKKQANRRAQKKLQAEKAAQKIIENQEQFDRELVKFEATQKAYLQWFEQEKLYKQRELLLNPTEESIQCLTEKKDQSFQLENPLIRNIRINMEPKPQVTANME